ncbi:hypothetical protein [Mongoliitalea lutea]|uniref:Uncharacterized protein n=1 Tax=Mongoliitalea lutea TaxID=849756 RepID=A0A8J3G6G2_9BACT|nr:hypothetical protein [Mongoliitalea lutea]GHB44525.1 hypothetical protein GCM10008106_27000 [Mongoliitalea lutea]
MDRLKKTLIVIIPLLVGGLIYIIFRVDTLIMFRWFESIGIQDLIIFLRSLKSEINLPEWIIYSLPDGLWIFSFTYCMLVIWDFKLTKNSFFWITIAPIIGLVSELGQLINIVPGTFDIVDLIIVTLSTAIPFLYLRNFKSIKNLFL